MLTVNIQTKKGSLLVAEETISVHSVRQVTTEFRSLDGMAPEHPGVEIHFDNEGHHTLYNPRDDGFHYEFYVMNEAGATINRLVL